MTRTNPSRKRNGPGTYPPPDWDRVRELRSRGVTWDAIASEMNNTSSNLKVMYHLRTDPEFRERQRARARRGIRLRRARIREILRAAKDQPCIDCGVRLPAECMDLDHVRGDKKFNPSRATRGRAIDGPAGEINYVSIEMLHEEIAKCEVRCPNCHRLRHYREQYAKSSSRQMKLAM